MQRRLLVPKLTDVLFVATFLASVLLGWRMLNTDGDLGRDLTLGNIILTTHRIPTTDLLSWTRAGEPRPAYEWLAQLAFGAANRVFGLDGVVVLVSLIIASAFGIVVADAVRRSGMPLLSMLVCGLAAIASSIHWLARPHIFSFLFLALWLGGLEEVRRGPTRWSVGLPLLMAIWANTHGGFIFGFAAWIAYLGGWMWDWVRHKVDRDVGRRLLATGALSLVASAVTPDLWRNWQAVLANRSAFILSQTVETMPPRLAMPAAWPFFALVVLGLAAALLNARRLRADHVLLLAGLASAGLLMARNIPLFAIAAAPVLTSWIADILQRSASWSRWEENLGRVEASLVGWVWPSVAVLGIAAALMIQWGRTHSDVFRLDESVFPAQAVDWIGSHPVEGRVFNDFNWGGYLLYRLWPGQRVYIDSQSDFYGEPLMRQYAGILAGKPGWQDALARDDVEWLIVRPNEPIAGAALAGGAWRLAYQDQTAVILIRK